MENDPIYRQTLTSTQWTRKFQLFFQVNGGVCNGRRGRCNISMIRRLKKFSELLMCDMKKNSHATTYKNQLRNSNICTKGRKPVWFKRTADTKNEVFPNSRRNQYLLSEMRLFNIALRTTRDICLRIFHHLCSHKIEWHSPYYWSFKFYLLFLLRQEKTIDWNICLQLSSFDKTICT